MMKKVVRDNWANRFELVGKPKINDYTFKTDAKSEKSAWVYNAMSLYVDCGEKYGDILCEMMGGYNSEGDSFIYAHGKDAEGKDDYSENGRITVEWNDRFNQTIINDLGERCFFTVGIEKDTEGKTFYAKFLSEYDAIAYIQKHLTEDMVLRIKGELNYSLYNGNVTVKKKVRSIVLSKVEDRKDFKATFTQSVLLDKDSVSLKNVDKVSGELPVYGKVLDYVKEINGTEIKTFYPMPLTFYYRLDLSKEEVWNTLYNKLFKVKKGITQINFEGELIENGTVTISYDELPAEIRELVELGAYSKEEALAKCTANTSKDKKMYLTMPVISMVGEGKDKMPQVMKFEMAYTEEDLFFEIAEEEDADVEVEDNTTSVNTDSSMDWLNIIK